MSNLKQLIGSFHNHSTYSLIDAVSSPADMVKFHAEQGTKWVGLTDHGHLSGLYELEQAAEKYDVQHIAACEFYVLIPELNTYGHLTTLAYNDVGRKNLLTLFHKSWDTLSKAKWGKKKPQITWELLEKYKEGLFVGTGCLVSVLGRCITNDRMDLAEKNLDKLIEIFGKDKVFAEIIPHTVNKDYNHKTGQFEPNTCFPWCPDGDYQKGYLLWLWDHAVIKRKLKPVLTTDAHFTTPDKKKIQDAILMNGESGWHFERSHHILTPEEMFANVRYLPGHNEALHNEMVENAVFFCENVKYSKTDKKIKLPFEFKTQEESLAAFADNVLEERVSKICECHSVNDVGKTTKIT